MGLKNRKLMSDKEFSSLIKKDSTNEILLHDAYAEIDKFNNGIYKATKSKSLRFSEWEWIILDSFLQANSLSVSALAKFFIFQDGGFSDIDVHAMQHKSLNVDFASINPSQWDLSYRKLPLRGKIVDVFKMRTLQLKREMDDSDKDHIPAMSLHMFQFNLISEHIKDKEDIYFHFQGFFKTKLFEYNIFPSAMKEMSLGNMRKSVCKGAAINYESEITTRAVTLTTSAFERVFINNLVACAKKQKPWMTAASLIKYSLFANGIISDMSRHPYAEAEPFLFELKNSFNPMINYATGYKFPTRSREDHEKKYAQMSGRMENLTIVLDLDDAAAVYKAYEHSGFKSLTSYIRNTVLRQYNIYPTDEIFDIIENPPRKQKNKTAV